MKKFFMQKGGASPDDLWEEYPNTNRLSFCDKCMLVLWVDQPGGPFEKITDECVDVNKREDCRSFNNKIKDGRNP